MSKKRTQYPGRTEVIRELFGWQFVKRTFCGRVFYSYRCLSSSTRTMESEHRKVAWKIARAENPIYFHGFKLTTSYTRKSWVYNDGNGRSGWSSSRPTKAVLLAVPLFVQPARIQFEPLDEGAKIDERLYGIRVFEWNVRRNKLLSPIQRTVWTTQTLKAGRWSNDAAIRGTCGIHAAWPARNRERLPSEIHSYRGNFGSHIGTNPNVVGEVVGWGRCAVGDLGWRAEYVMILRVYANSKEQVEQIQKVYPEIEVVHVTNWGKPSLDPRLRW